MTCRGARALMTATMKPKPATLNEPFPYSLPKEKIRILLLEGISDTAVNVLTSAGYTSIERVSKALDGEELRTRLKGVRLLGIRSRTQLTASAIDGIAGFRGVAAGRHEPGRSIHHRAPRIGPLPSSTHRSQRSALRSPS